MAKWMWLCFVMTFAAGLCVGEEPAALPPAEPPAERPTRDPFWPVGYVPQGAAVEEENKQDLLDLSRLSPEEQAIIKSHMRVGGILEQGNRRIAIINKDVVKEGDVMTLRVSGQSYRFLIRSLQPENIVLEPLVLEDKPQEQE